MKNTVSKPSLINIGQKYISVSRDKESGPKEQRSNKDTERQELEGDDVEAEPKRLVFTAQFLS